MEILYTCWIFLKFYHYQKYWITLIINGNYYDWLTNKQDISLYTYFTQNLWYTIQPKLKMQLSAVAGPASLADAQVPRGNELCTI